MAANVVLRVARSHHMAVEVVARRPYVGVLADCIALVRADREAALTREFEQLRGGKIVNASITGGSAYPDLVRDFNARAAMPVVASMSTEGLSPGEALLARAIREAQARQAAQQPPPAHVS